ncbi:MAG: ABC transporter ATP-binding protein [Planctomycetota bacterium]|jgi:ABC-2 type transport system ATP-binding protein
MSESAAMLLDARHLAKRYGPFQALHDVSVHLEAGEIVGFLGPNGAGKSTTMKILSGFLAPSSGSAQINGHDLADEPLACRRQIGYLPQELPLYRDMTVAAYLDHVARLKGIAPGQRRNEVVQAIGRADLGEVEKRHIHKLSGGNRQRVGLAQALIGTPPILILDEPTAGLDPAQVANFRDLIRSLAAEHSILLSTHILAEVEACCSRVVVVDRGRDILAESIDDLRRRSRQLRRLRIRVRTGEPADLCRLAQDLAWIERSSVDGDAVVIEAAEERRGELVALVEANGGVRELVEERRSLEDVFRDLVAARPAAVSS